MRALRLVALRCLRSEGLWLRALIRKARESFNLSPDLPISLNRGIYTLTYGRNPSMIEGIFLNPRLLEGLVVLNIRVLSKILGSFLVRVLYYIGGPRKGP